VRAMAALGLDVVLNVEIVHFIKPTTDATM
jgi:hypothetical protein